VNAVEVFKFIDAEKTSFPIAFMCRRLGASKAGYYAWRERPTAERAVADARISKLIHQIHAGSRGTYGAPRIHAELSDDYGIRCGRKRVARLMRIAKLRGVCRRRRVKTTRRDEQAQLSDDLVQRQFNVAEPNALWIADITYLPTWQGFLYLAVVIDAYSRRVVGWSMANHLRTELVLDALEMALWNRRPAPGLIHHSDHGCQYTSLAFGRRCRDAGIAASMGSIGDCFDNAMCESFFASLECELIDRNRWRTHTEVRMAVFDYIECFYNPRRRHSALGYLSPAQFERRTHSQTTAA
jgi:putative transposase